MATLNHVRVRACLAHHALEGHLGRPAHASVEQTGGRAYLVLRRPGLGSVVAGMLLSGLELVDIGAGRVLIVPKIEPSDLTMDRVGFLTLEDAEDFWDMVHRARTATHRDIQGGKLHSPWTPSTSAPAHRRQRRELPAIPEVPRAEAAGAEREGAWEPTAAYRHNVPTRRGQGQAQCRAPRHAAGGGARRIAAAVAADAQVPHG
jgi:hypothetical protein